MKYYLNQVRPVNLRISAKLDRLYFSGHIPMISNAEEQLARRVRHTVSFLRMASIECGLIAEAAPDISAQLLHLARQLAAEADDLAQRHSA